MAFYVDYTEANVKKWEKKIDDLEKFHICWNTKENEFVLISKNRIRSDPLGYIKYAYSIPSSEESVGEKRKKVELVTNGQIKQF